MDIKPAWQELALTIPAGQSATPLSSVWFGEVLRIMAPAGIQGPGLRVLLARADGTGLCPLIGVNGAVNVYPLGAAATAGGWLETPRGVFPRLRQFALEAVSDAAGTVPQAQSADRALVVAYLPGPQYGTSWTP
jgi:hypothetical protein